MNICALLGILSIVIILKIPFSSTPAISFCLDVVYWAIGILIFLINLLDSSIRKKKSYRTAILACSKYLLGCLRFCLTKAREAKFAKSDLVAYFILKISARDVFVWGISADVNPVEDFFAVHIYMGIGLSSKSS